ncbi:MAG: alpha-amylase family glycosyl hydrolase [Atribacterota bacterium]
MWKFILGCILCLSIIFSINGLVLAAEFTFTYVPLEDEEVVSVSLRGSFNSWGEWPMEKQPDGTWSITVDLEPGEYQYKFFINGKWPQDMSTARAGGPVDPNAIGYVNDGFGGQNAICRIKEEITGGVNLVHNPDDPAYLCIADERLVIRLKTSPHKVAKVYLVTDEGKWIMERQLQWEYGEVFRLSLELPDSLKYRFIGYTIEDTEFFLPEDPSQSFFFDGVNYFPQLKWVSKGIIYQIFPDRFYNGNPKNDVLALKSDEFHYNQLWAQNKLWAEEGPSLANWNAPISSQHCCHQYFGGDLAGIIEKLDYLKEFGVTALYLNPIFDSGSAHGYDTHDYMKVSPKFGTEEDLQGLLNEAHKRGMRVILDFVPNHTGLGFWAFQDVVKNGEDSPYWDWYFIHKWPFTPGDPAAYEAWWGVGSLPKLNTGNPEVKEYLLKVVSHWLNFSADGWRVDVPNELVEAQAFFREMRQITKMEKPDAFLIAEIWQLDPSWVQGDQYDSLMNYALGRDILLNFAKGSVDGEGALANLSRYFAAYGENVTAMGFNLLSSHDTGRILTDLGGGNFGDLPNPEAVEKLKLLSTLLYTLPGAPVIFQGDERGILGEKEFYDAHRYPIQWDTADESLKSHYKKLAQLRQEIPVLTSSVIRVYYGTGQLLSFFRGEQGSGQVLIVANNGTETVKFELPYGNWRSVTKGEVLQGTIYISPLQVRIFERL